MNCKKLLLTIAASSVLCASTALASDIYRYTDENGNTIYVDRPTGKPGETRVNVSSLDSDYSTVQARVQTRHDAAAAKEERAAEEGDKEPTRGEKRAAAAAKEQQCQGYRTQLESFVTARRLYRDDANGERVYLNEEESQESRDRMEALIQENCN